MTMKHLYYSTRFVPLAAAALALSLAPMAKGDVLVSTLDKPFSTDGNAGLGVGNWTSFLFTTGSESLYLDRVITNLDFTLVPLGSFAPAIYQTSGGLPTTAIFTDFTYTPIDDSGDQQIIFTANSSLQLAPNTTYSFAIRPQELTDSGVWRIVDLAEGYDGTGGMPPSIIQSYNNGTTWVDAGGGSYRLSAEVQVSPIPEPATWALLGGAGAFLVLGATRRRVSRRK